MKQNLPIRNSFPLLLVIAGALIFSRCSNKNTSSAETSSQDSLDFGDTKFLSNGLKGKIYLLTPGTSRLPDFDTLQAVDTLYAHSIDVPARSWKTGFPGLPDRFEWFGIEYNGRFNVIKSGRYTFRLASDDGSRLFIDDSLVINNDGLHGVTSKTGVIDLDNAEHKIKIQYMQGPRWSIALQLFARLDNEKEQVFPGKYFTIASSEKSFFFQNFIFFISAIVLAIFLIIIFALRNRMKSSSK